MSAHPIQPVEKDAHGALRFKANAIVQHLLDRGGIDMNALHRIEFSDEDRQQFAQLIGYSLSGYGELGYVTNEAFEAAALMHANVMTEDKARIAALETELSELRTRTRAAVNSLAELVGSDYA